MKEHPILFSGAMVSALLAGTKTQTRREVKPQFAPEAVPAEMCATNEQGHQVSGHSGMWWDDEASNADEAVRCPYGQPGDRLWVRETFAHIYRDNAKPDERRDEDVAYKADHPGLDEHAYGSWKPSIHMPRWACRIVLEIVSVRVERLQDISDADAVAEGTAQHPDGPWHAFRSLWSLINGADSWDANPWVWVVEFKRVQP